MDGGSGNRLQSDYAIGQCGDVGQYTYFALNNSPEATGYSYTKIGKDIIIDKGSGAVGFKVYNGKGEYMAMSNKLKFTIPEELAADPGIKIVAAEGDGDEVVLTPYVDKGGNAPKTALRNALNATKYYITYTDKTSTKVGYYYENNTNKNYVLLRNQEHQNSGMRQGHRQELHRGVQGTQLEASALQVHFQSLPRSRLVKVAFYFGRPGTFARPGISAK